MKFINELGEDLSGVKAERARLREELEARDILIQKVCLFLKAFSPSFTRFIQKRLRFRA